MAKVYYPIRSFGDFIITAAVVRHHFAGLIPILLPDYMRDIFSAIDGREYFQIVGDVNFSNQPAFFEMYKVRDIENIKRLIKDFKTLYMSVDKDEYLLDYRSRRIRFMNSNFSWPSDKLNIYEAKQRFLLKHGLISAGGEEVKPVKLARIKKVIVLPDSRVNEKRLSPVLVKELQCSFPDQLITVGYFGASTTKNDNIVSYQDFAELLGLLRESDLIISAESLPYHLAYFIGKPHFVIYNISRHFKPSFMTPFMLRYDAFVAFNGADFQTVVNKIEGFILKTNVTA